MLVDFPGFDDSNGPLISIGIEFALKTLLTKYNSQIFVIESITNVEGRFVAVDALGSHLSRLIKNKEDCLLGMTKYTRDSDYLRICSIELQQEKDLFTPSQEEKNLEIKIETLSKLNMPGLQGLITLSQEELDILRKKKEEDQQAPVPETEEEREARTRLQEREKEFLKDICLRTIIRFDAL